MQRQALPVAFTRRSAFVSTSADFTESCADAQYRVGEDVRLWVNKVRPHALALRALVQVGPRSECLPCAALPRPGRAVQQPAGDVQLLLPALLSAQEQGREAGAQVGRPGRGAAGQPADRLAAGAQVPQCAPGSGALLPRTVWMPPVHHTPSLHDKATESVSPTLPAARPPSCQLLFFLEAAMALLWLCYGSRSPTSHG